MEPKSRQLPRSSVKFIHNRCIPAPGVTRLAGNDFYLEALESRPENQNYNFPSGDTLLSSVDFVGTLVGSAVGAASKISAGFWGKAVKV